MQGGPAIGVTPVGVGAGGQKSDGRRPIALVGCIVQVLLAAPPGQGEIGRASCRERV